jgi:hypothetical protein
MMSSQSPTTPYSPNSAAWILSLPGCIGLILIAHFATGGYKPAIVVTLVLPVLLAVGSLAVWVYLRVYVRAVLSASTYRTSPRIWVGAAISALPLLSLALIHLGNVFEMATYFPSKFVVVSLLPVWGLLIAAAYGHMTLPKGPETFRWNPWEAVAVLFFAAALLVLIAFYAVKANWTVNDPAHLVARCNAEGIAPKKTHVVAPSLLFENHKTLRPEFGQITNLLLRGFVFIEVELEPMPLSKKAAQSSQQQYYSQIHNYLTARNPPSHPYAKFMLASTGDARCGPFDRYIQQHASRLRDARWAGLQETQCVAVEWTTKPTAAVVATAEPEFLLSDGKPVNSSIWFRYRDRESRAVIAQLWTSDFCRSSFDEKHAFNASITPDNPSFTNTAPGKLEERMTFPLHAKATIVSVEPEQVIPEKLVSPFVREIIDDGATFLDKEKGPHNMVTSALNLLRGKERTRLLLGDGPDLFDYCYQLKRQGDILRIHCERRVSSKTKGALGDWVLELTDSGKPLRIIELDMNNKAAERAKSGGARDIEMTPDGLLRIQKQYQVDSPNRAIVTTNILFRVEEAKRE